MNLQTVADQMRAALDTVPGLVVPPWGSKASGLPAALVGWPDRISFTETYGRGKAGTNDWTVVLAVGTGTDARSAHTRLAALLSDQPGGALAALEAGPYTACDYVHVVDAEIDEGKYAGANVLVAIMHCQVIGPGR